MRPREPHEKLRTAKKTNRTKAEKRFEGKYETLSDFKDVVEEYFKVMPEAKRPLTVSGLCVHLGFSRQTLCNYEARGVDWAECIELAKMRIENYTEEALFDGGKVGGAKFILQNRNGWVTKTDNKVEGSITLEVVTGIERAPNEG